MIINNLSFAPIFFAFFLTAFAEDCTIETDLIYQSDSKIPEASDITKVYHDFYIVGDDTCAISKLDDNFDVITLPTDQCSGKSDFEALFRLPTDTDSLLPTLVICREDAQNCSPWRNGAFIDDWPLVDGGEGCHDSVYWGINKGIEGAHGFLSDQGETKMLALIELDGKLITYKLVGRQWVSESCTYVPVDFEDYSGLSILESTMAVVSQKSRAMFVTTISDLNNSNFAINDGQVYDFDRNFEGVEGIFLEPTQPGNIINGVISSDDQGSGDYANAVHAFSVVCNLLTTDSVSTPDVVSTSNAASTSSAPVDPTVQYYLAAHCDQRSEFITSANECEQAAISLNLIDTSVESITNEDRPYGCFFKESGQSNQLWLNKDDDADRKLTDSLRQSVCKQLVSVSQSPSLSPTQSSTSDVSTIQPTTIVEITSMKPTSDVSTTSDMSNSPTFAPSFMDPSMAPTFLETTNNVSSTSDVTSSTPTTTTKEPTLVLTSHEASAISISTFGLTMMLFFLM